MAVVKRLRSQCACSGSVVTIGLSERLLQLSEKLSELSDCESDSRQTVADSAGALCRGFTVGITVGVTVGITVGYCRTVGILSEYCRILSDKPVGLSDRGSTLHR